MNQGVNSSQNTTGAGCARSFRPFTRPLQPSRVFRIKGLRRLARLETLSGCYVGTKGKGFTTWKQFMSTASAAGKKFFLVHDPRVAIEHLVQTGKINKDELMSNSSSLLLEHLVQTGKINKDELFDISELRHDLNQDAITAEPNPPEPLTLVPPLRKAR